MMQYLR